jgi:hypothetical protein
MNQFFSFRRFNLLVLQHWANNKKRYGLSVLAFVGLLIVWFVFAIIIEDDNLMSIEFQKSSFFLGLFAVGTFYASQFFRDLASRAKGITFLLVPASTFEKFLCSLLYTLVLFFMIYTACFYLVDALMVTITNSLDTINKPNGEIPLINVFDITFFSLNNDATLNFLLFFFSVQSVFLLGSVYFRKYNFLKTIISVFVTWFILFLVFYFIYYQNSPEGSVENYGPIANWSAHLIQGLVYSIAPLFWIVSYYRLKQKQV